LVSSRIILIWTHLLIVHEICGKIHLTVSSHHSLDMPNYQERKNTAPNCTAQHTRLRHSECIGM
jgi:hypothetical protein